MLAVCRGVQGIGGGGILQLAQISISDIVPLAQRPKYMGALGSLWGISSVLGPLIGTCIGVSLKLGNQHCHQVAYSAITSLGAGELAYCTIHCSNTDRRGRAFFINLPTGGIAIFLLCFLRVRGLYIEYSAPGYELM
jgi:MFS family permease